MKCSKTLDSPYDGTPILKCDNEATGTSCGNVYHTDQVIGAEWRDLTTGIGVTVMADLPRKPLAEAVVV